MDLPRMFHKINSLSHSTPLASSGFTLFKHSPEDNKYFKTIFSLFLYFGKDARRDGKRLVR